MDPKKIGDLLGQTASKRNRLSAKVEAVLNAQIAVELNASQVYQAMAAWCSWKGLSGTAKFLFKHAGEEREHMQKVYNYMLDRGALPKTPEVKAQVVDYVDLKTVLNKGLDHEISVSGTWVNVYKIAMEECDHITEEFTRWYFKEQREEEAIFIELIDRLDLIGSDKVAIVLLDKEIGELA